jgi:signal transduction histidine kinase
MSVNKDSKKADCRSETSDVIELKDVDEQLYPSYQKLAIFNEKLLVIGGLTRHDVQNKLMIVKGNTFLLRKKIGNNSELIQYIDSINTALLETERLFEFSRCYEKMGSEQIKEINIANSFNDAVSVFGNLNVEVINECQGLIVLADSLFTQLFYNLIDNSLKHGEKVTKIRLSFSTGKNSTELVYEDDGVGIPDGIKSKLFTKGFTTGNGSGYGLALVKKIVDVYGWKIKELGESGKGARFVISIPDSNLNVEDNYQIAHC